MLVLGMIDRQERLTLAERRFPPPRSVEETDACFIVRDANGQALATSTSRWNLESERAAKLLTRGERNRSRYSFLWLRPPNKKHESPSNERSRDRRPSARGASQPPRRERARHQLPNAIPVERNDEKKIEFTKQVMDRADGGDDYTRSVAVGHF